MSSFRAFLGQRFIVKFSGHYRVKGQVKMVFPSELESGFRKRVVVVSRAGMALGKVGGMLVLEEWSVQSLSHGSPCASQPLMGRAAFTVSGCHANFICGSGSPAGGVAGFGFSASLGNASMAGAQACRDEQFEQLSMAHKQSTTPAFSGVLHAATGERAAGAVAKLSLGTLSPVQYAPRMKMNPLNWIAAGVAAFLVSCVSNSAPTHSPPTNRPLRLAFITCARDARFFEPVKQGMNDAGRMLGVRCDWQGTPGVDVKAQAELVRQAVAQGYDGIAVSLIDPVAFDAVVEEAIQAGVPVVAFNVDDHATPNARLAAVNQRLYEAGRSLGEHLAPSITAGSHVLLTLHDEGVSALEDRRRGIQDALQSKNVKWTVLVTGNVSAEGADVIADALRKHPDIRVVLGTGQADTEAGGLAIEQQLGDQGYWSAGFDLSENTLRLIQAGHIRCTIDQQPYVQGFYPVVMLTQYLRYGLKPSSLDAGAVVIDRSNAAQVLELTRKHYR